MSGLPPYSLKAMHYQNEEREKSQSNTTIHRRRSKSYTNIEDISRNMLKINLLDKRKSPIKLINEDEGNIPKRSKPKEMHITPFQLSTDHQFRSVLPYLMIEAFFLIIVINANDAVTSKSFLKNYQFPVISAFLLLIHHIILDTSVSYLSKWERLTPKKVLILMFYSILTIVSTLGIWLLGDYKANWIVPKHIMIFWCICTFLTWQCMFIRLYEYRLYEIENKKTSENIIWRSKDNKQKYYQKSL